MNAEELALQRKVEAIHPWHHKGGTAFEFKVVDSDYRVYKPALVSLDTGQYKIVSTLNHDRKGADDDDAALFIEMNLAGDVTKMQCVIQFAPPDQTAEGFSVAADMMFESAQNVADGGGPGSRVAMGLHVSAGVSKLVNYILERNEKDREQGGRQAFPHVVEAVATRIISHVRQHPLDPVRSALSLKGINQVYPPNDKDGQGHRLVHGGSNYRVWRGDCQYDGYGGYFLHTKIDHIRGGKQDDNFAVSFRVNSAGQMVNARVAGRMRDYDAVGTGPSIEAAVAQAFGAPGAPTDGGRRYMSEVVGNVMRTLEHAATRGFYGAF